MFFPIWFDTWASSGGALIEELVEVFGGVEALGALALLEALSGGGAEPCAKGHTFPARLMREAVAVFVGDYELDPGHWSILWRRECVCMIHIIGKVVKEVWGAGSVSVVVM